MRRWAAVNGRLANFEEGLAAAGERKLHDDKAARLVFGGHKLTKWPLIIVRISPPSLICHYEQQLI